MLIQALLYGLAASSALVVGAIIGSYARVPKRLVAAALALASGSLTAALAFELFAEALRQGGISWSGLGFVLGASVFAVTDALLDRFAEGGGEQSAFALLAGVTLDGVPENLALGIPLLFAIFASNLPETLGSADRLTGAGRSKRFAIGIWAATGALLAGSVVLGTAGFGGVGEEALAVMLAFAAGAVPASLADTLSPRRTGAAVRSSPSPRPPDSCSLSSSPRSTAIRVILEARRITWQTGMSAPPGLSFSHTAIGTRAAVHAHPRAPNRTPIRNPGSPPMALHVLILTCILVIAEVILARSVS